MSDSAKPLGYHYFFEFYDCSTHKLSLIEPVRKAMLEAAEYSGATIVKDVFHQFSPQGVSGVVVIEESHLSIHTWPEHGYAAVDFFTCSLKTYPKKAMQHLAKELGSTRSEMQYFERGSIQHFRDKSA